MPQILLLGHRGSGGTAPIAENTFSAFDFALEHGCDGFEFDLRLTACGRAVVCHNARVYGVTVARANRTQLRDLPILEDVFLRYGRRGFLNVELKVRGLEQKVLTVLRDHPPQRDYIISSFIPEVLLEIKARRNIPVGIICKNKTQLERWPGLPADYIIAHKSLLSRSLVEKIHKASRKIMVWTVNQPQLILRFASWHVDGIISDYPALLAHTMGRPPAAPAVRVN